MGLCAVSCCYRKRVGSQGVFHFFCGFLETTLRVVHVKDLVAVPVNREQCVSASLPGILDPSRQNHSSTHRLFSTDEEYINLTWKLSYSGGSPRTIMLSNAFGLIQEYNMTDTEYNKAMAHRTAQSMREQSFPMSVLCLTCIYIHPRGSTWTPVRRKHTPKAGVLP